MKRKTLLRAGQIASVGGAALSFAGLIQSLIAQRRFAKALRESKGKATLDSFRRSGLIPKGSRVITTKKKIEEALCKQVLDFDSMNDFEKNILKIQMSDLASQISKGKNAVYLGTDDKNRPAFALSKKNLLADVVAHEVGHSIADAAMPEGEYTQKYMDAATSIPTPIDIFAPDRDKDMFGNMTRVGYENEAWDKAPIKIKNNNLRDAAVGTYSANRRHKAMALYGMLLGLAGLGTTLYAANKA